MFFFYYGDKVGRIFLRKVEKNVSDLLGLKEGILCFVFLNVLKVKFLYF